MPDPDVHRNACESPVAMLAIPAMAPASLTSAAFEPEPPSVPRSTIPVPDVHRNARVVVAVCAHPTTSPDSLIAVASEEFPPKVPRSVPGCGGPAWAEPAGTTSVAKTTTSAAGRARIRGFMTAT